MKTERVYNTKQRDLILDCIRGSEGGSITAEDIVLSLTARGTPVGKSTVYRCLSILAEEGVVRKYTADDGLSASYQYMSNPEACSGHFHLKCNRCGTLLHADGDMLASMRHDVLTRYNFHLDNVKTVLYGMCADCEKD